MEITIPPTGPFEDGTGPFEDGKGAKASKDTLYWVNARPAMDQFKQAGRQEMLSAPKFRASRTRR